MVAPPVSRGIAWRTIGSMPRRDGALGLFRRAAAAAAHRRQRRHRHDLDRVRHARADAAAAAGGARRRSPRCRSSVQPKLPGHMCTGPVAVRGAKAGQVLEVRIKAIELHYDWGYNISGPLTGALPDDFIRAGTLMHIPLDEAKKTGRLPWGLELPLRAVLRRDGGRAAAGLGQRLDAAAAQERRQSRQQGAGGGHHALSADPCRRRAVLGRRRARRAGRRRGVRHGHRDRADRHLRAPRARGHARWSGRAPRRRRTS